jgi:hypothetical protein
MINPMAITATEQADAAQWARTRDAVARHFLGISAAEFVLQYTEGRFQDDVPGLMAVLALFPELD